VQPGERHDEHALTWPLAGGSDEKARAAARGGGLVVASPVMRRNWGTLIVSHLAGAAPLLLNGCASAPPPPVEEPAPPPPVASVEQPAPLPPSELPDPEGATTGLASFVPLGTAAPAGTMPLGAEQLVPFGGGVLAVGDLIRPEKAPMPACLFPEADREACQFIRIAPWAAAPPAAAFTQHASAQAVGPWGALARSPQKWASFTGAPGGVYAVRKGSSLTIDRIDQKGEISLVGEFPSSPGDLSGVHVVETAGGLVALGTTMVGRQPELVVMPIKRGGSGKLELGTAVSTSIATWTTGDLAMDVRARTDRKHKPTVGPWVAAPALDASGALDSSLYVAWTEAIIPPRKGGKMPTKIRTPDCGGCGCLSSRLLEDGSVKKKIHVTRFSEDGKQLADRVVKLPAVKPATPEEEGLPLTLRPTLIPTEYGYSLNGQPFDRESKPLKEPISAPRPADALAASPPLTGLTLQTVGGAAYDQATGEGVVVLKGNGKSGVARFDGLGRLVGDIAWLDVDVTSTSRAMVRVGGRWLALDKAQQKAVVLTGPTQGTVIAIPLPEGWTMKPGFAEVSLVDDSHALVARQAPKYAYPPATHPGGLLLSTIDLTTGTASPWELAPGWFLKEGEEPRLNEVRSVQRTEDGSLLLAGSDTSRKFYLIKRDAAGTWGDPVVLGEDARSDGVTVRDVWKDRVVALMTPTVEARWLRADATASFKRLATDSYEERSTHVGEVAGPMLFGGSVALGAAPGEPAPLAKDTSQHAGACPFSFATGPRRLVLVCTEATDTDRPSSRVGLRVLRF
jgi:hypothetical protein